MRYVRSVVTLLVLLGCSSRAVLALEAPLPPTEEVTFLEPLEKECAWYRYHLRSKEKTLLSRFPGGCEGGAIAWSQDRSQALVSFSDLGNSAASYFSKDSEPGTLPPETNTEIQTRLYLVALSGGRQSKLSLPKVPESAHLEDLGFDRENRPTLLFLQDIPETEIHQGVLHFEGKDYPAKVNDGLMAMAFSLVWKEKDKAWVKSEVDATDTGADYSRGVSNLKVHSELGPRTSTLLSLQPAGDEVKDPALLAQLKKYGDGQWIRLQGTDILVWEVSIEFVWSTGRIFFVQDGKVQPLPELKTTAGDLIAPMVEPPYLLLTSGNGRALKVYDLRSHSLIFSAPKSQASSFWPHSLPRNPRSRS